MLSMYCIHKDPKPKQSHINEYFYTMLFRFYYRVHLFHFLIIRNRIFLFYSCLFRAQIILIVKLETYLIVTYKYLTS